MVSPDGSNGQVAGHRLWKRERVTTGLLANDTLNTSPTFNPDIWMEIVKCVVAHCHPTTTSGHGSDDEYKKQ